MGKKDTMEFVLDDLFGKEPDPDLTVLPKIYFPTRSTIHATSQDDWFWQLKCTSIQKKK